MNKIYVLIGHRDGEDYVVMGGGSSTRPSVKSYVKKGMAVRMAKVYKKHDPTVDAYEFDFADANRVTG